MSPKSYYCKALQGESEYNICINSDMTISCNCQDYDGAGQLGDLGRKSFEDIFFGATAQRFRRKLLEGHFPVSVCAGCAELLETTADPEHYLTGCSLPHIGIMVENTVLCNLQCVACRRDQLLRTRKKVSMSLDDIRKVAQIFQKHHIQRCHFFGLGEPFLSKHVYDEVSILRQLNPSLQICTSTNGHFLQGEDKIRATLMMDLIYFSIDGASQETLEKYQKGGDFSRALCNMDLLVRARNRSGSRIPVIEWKYVVFSWNDSEQEIERAIKLAKESGVDAISFWQGGGPPPAISQKFQHDDYFAHLGEKSWKGREINLRQDFIASRVLQQLKPAECHRLLRALRTDSRALADSCVAIIESAEKLSNKQFILRSYQKLLGREPDPPGLDSWLSMLDAGTLSRAQMVQSIIDSVEFLSVNPAKPDVGPDVGWSMTRAQIAREIVQLCHGDEFEIPAEPFFVDVPREHPDFRFIQRFRQDELTTSWPRFDPDTPVTRYMLATFLVRARYGERFDCPEGPRFKDVPPTHANARYIRKAAADGMIEEISPDFFYPDDPVSREECRAALESWITKWRAFCS